MKIEKYGKVTITEKENLIERFTFSGDGSMLDGAGLALDWAKEMIEKRHEEYL